MGRMPIQEARSTLKFGNALDVLVQDCEAELLGVEAAVHVRDVQPARALHLRHGLLSAKQPLCASVMNAAYIGESAAKAGVENGCRGTDSRNVRL